MKLKLLSLSAVLCLSILFIGARVAAAQEVQPLEPEWLRQMYEEGWQKLQEGVLQRETGEGQFETFTYGEEGWRWLVQSYESRVADLRSRQEASPSAELDQVIDQIEGEIARLNQSLQTVPAAESFDGEVLQSCTPSYDGEAFAGPQTESQGVTARADAYFHNSCGYLGDTFAQAYAHAIAGTVETTRAQSDPQNAGTWIDSHASASAEGSTGCESYAQATVTSTALGIAFQTPLVQNFTCLRPLSQGGQNIDVGTVGLAGSASFGGNGSFTIGAGGEDLWESTDAFHFVYQTLSGDGEIVARVANLINPAGATGALAAVMMREKLTADSIHAAMMVTTTGKAKFRRRTTTGGTTWSDGPSDGTTSLPRWLKLTRSGDSFSAFLSADGITWTQVHTTQTITMSETVYVGILALRTGSSTETATATFDNVSLRRIVPPLTAEAGGPYTTTAGQQVQLDGSRSSAPGGSITSHLWSFRDEIVLYASDFANTDLHGRWQKVSTPDAAGGVLLRNADLGEAKLSTPLASPTNYVEIRFTAVQGVPYHLWIRLRAEADHWDNDAITVQFSSSVDAAGNPIFRIGTTQGDNVSLEEGSGGVQGWGWNDNDYGGLADPIYFDSSGVQTLRIQQRQDGVLLDQIVLSAGTYYDTRPGILKNDTTIVPKTLGTAEGAAPWHAFRFPGAYLVLLTVTDSSGAQASDTATVTVN